MRGKGTGSVRQLESGKWQARYRVSGQSMSQTYAAKNQMEAEKELRRILRTIDTGQYCAPDKKTVTDYLREWVRDKGAAVAAGNLRESSLESYEEIIERHIVPHLGQKRLDQLTAEDVKHFYASLALTESKRRPGQYLAVKTRRGVHVMFKQALDHAVLYDKIPRNPIDRVQKDLIPGTEEPEHQILTVAQTLSLLALTQGTFMEIPILLAVVTGMRRGELLGLFWDDLDLTERLIHVRQQLVYTRGETQLGPVKNRGGVRDIDLPVFCLSRLAQHQREQDPKSLFVISHPRHPDRLSHAFSEALKKTGLPRVKLHELRHTHATHLLEADPNPKVIQDRLGHADVTITLKLYSHLTREKKRQAAQTVDRLYATVDENQMVDGMVDGRNRMAAS